MMQNTDRLVYINIYILVFVLTAGVSYKIHSNFRDVKVYF